MKTVGRLFITFAIGALAVTGGTAFAAEAKTGAVAVVENPNKRACRKVKATGTHFAKRICMKNSEWAELRRKAQDEMSRSVATEAGGGN